MTIFTRPDPQTVDSLAEIIISDIRAMAVATGINAQRIARQVCARMHSGIEADLLQALDRLCRAEDRAVFGDDLAAEAFAEEVLQFGAMAFEAVSEFDGRAAHYGAGGYVNEDQWRDDEDE